MSGNTPPSIFMNMHAGTADADAGSTPKWVWYMVFGLGALAALGVTLYLIATAPI